MTLGLVTVAWLRSSRPTAYTLIASAGALSKFAQGIE